jgi:hypothetical protein
MRSHKHLQLHGAEQEERHPGSSRCWHGIQMQTPLIPVSTWQLLWSPRIRREASLLDSSRLKHLARSQARTSFVGVNFSFGSFLWVMLSITRDATETSFRSCGYTATSQYPANRSYVTIEARLCLAVSRARLDIFRCLSSLPQSARTASRSRRSGRPSCRDSAAGRRSASG